MQPTSLCTVSCLLYYFSKNLLSENKSKVCLPSLNKTCSYRSRWEHKGRKNSFQAEMSETSSDWNREKEIAFGTQSGTLAVHPVTRKRYSINQVKILMISIAFKLFFLCGNFKLWFLLYMVKWEVKSLLIGFRHKELLVFCKSTTLIGPGNASLGQPNIWKKLSCTGKC